MTYIVPISSSDLSNYCVTFHFINEYSATDVTLRGEGITTLYMTTLEWMAHLSKLHFNSSYILLNDKHTDVFQ